MMETATATLSTPFALLLLGAGVLAGAANAVAGGGTFFTFPAFLAAGLPPVVANASNAVAVWPGHALAVVGYRRELATFAQGMTGSIVIALGGGIAGSLLLAWVDNAAFAKLIPFLLLFATCLFGVGARISGRLAAPAAANGWGERGAAARVCEFCFAVYGGFFGAGLGVMLMAGLLMLGVNDLQTNNALKNLLAALVTSVSVAIFAAKGLVSWPHTLVTFVGAVVGGLLGAKAARLLPAMWLRRVVVAIGLALSVYYFKKYYA
ncbi:MAG: sulfite exporter TauE/SafE family protein [Sulfurifustaceae bacterium]